MLIESDWYVTERCLCEYFFIFVFLLRTTKIKLSLITSVDIFIVFRLVVGLVMLFRGVNGNGNDHCHWCHYLSCLPTSRWSCRNWRMKKLATWVFLFLQNTLDICVLEWHVTFRLPVGSQQADWDRSLGVGSDRPHVYTIIWEVDVILWSTILSIYSHVHIVLYACGSKFLQFWYPGKSMIRCLTS